MSIKQFILFVSKNFHIKCYTKLHLDNSLTAVTIVGTKGSSFYFKGFGNPLNIR